MRPLFAAALLLAATCASADPNVFGLELGVTTEDQLQNQYEVVDGPTPNNAGGMNYWLDPNDIELRELKSVRISMDDEGVLAGILLSLPKNRFGDIEALLAEKYELVERNVPHLGNKEALYQDGDSWVVAEAMHLSFSMNLTYVRKEFYAQSIAANRAERARQADQEKSGL